MRKLKIVISGMVAGDPWQGGATWAVLQYVLGLRQLGHEVLFVEPITAKQLRPAGARLHDSDNALYFSQTMRNFGLAGDGALLFANTRESAGVAYDELLRRACSSDLLINISGMLQEEEIAGSIPVRVYLDLDPAFNQLWNAVQGIDMRFDGHTHFVTVGLNLGQPSCPIPDCGRHWLKTFQPVVLEHWPVAESFSYNALTTVGNWRGYGSVEFDGRHYGQKAHSLREYLKLPTLTEEHFALALAIHPNETKDLLALAENRWELLDPRQFAGTPQLYQEFIQTSKAEFGVAKSGYAVSHCGWFSDRSVCYLASGRSVIAQETGFGDHLPTGTGLFSFTNTDEALTAIDSLNGSYQKHSLWARAIAEDYFDSRKVLTRLLAQVDS
jgi:hypothetical protein